MPSLNGGSRLVTLLDAQNEIRNADLLLFRADRSFVSRLIAGRGIHSHAAKAAWWDGELYCAEVREFHGGRVVTLSSQVQKFPKRIDVFRANAYGLPEMDKASARRSGLNSGEFYDRAGSIRMMKKMAGCDYGYGNVLRAGLWRLPFVRLRLDPDVEDDKIDHKPPFCSQACALSDRLGGGCDPVPMLTDRLTEPSDLAQSSFYKYLLTLVP